MTDPNGNGIKITARVPIIYAHNLNAPSYTNWIGVGDDIDSLEWSKEQCLSCAFMDGLKNGITVGLANGDFGGILRSAKALMQPRRPIPDWKALQQSDKVTTQALKDVTTIYGNGAFEAARLLKQAKLGTSTRPVGVPREYILSYKQAVQNNLTKLRASGKYDNNPEHLKVMEYRIEIYNI